MKALFARLKQRLPSFSARFHISVGLMSIVSTLVLVSLFAGVIPDRRGIEQRARLDLAEGLAATSAMLLRRGDLDGIRRALTLVVERNDRLDFIALSRARDRRVTVFGDGPIAEAAREAGGAALQSVEATPSADDRRIELPLLRGGRPWGRLTFHFADPAASAGFFAPLLALRGQPMALMTWLALLGFPLFYWYLGKVLKQLDPSAAVPGRVRSALDSIAECLVVIDRKGDLVLANAAFAKLAGQPADALVGSSLAALDWDASDPDEAAWVAPWDAVLDSGEAAHQIAAGYRAADGKARRFLINCSPVFAGDGQVGGVLISMDDVTRLEEQEMLLRESMQAAEQANEAKTAFLSNMSHEIRTPMTAILGFTDLLRRGPSRSEDDTRRHLDTIARSGSHLLALINDVLDLSKVEAGAMDVESIETDAAALAHDVVNVLGVKADEKGVALELDIASPLPAHILSDPARLRQIITNLVGNAIKFTEQGSVTLRLSFDLAAQRLDVDVVDTGIGMTDAQQDSVFDAFAQADASITRRFGGTGLGLSISRKLAEGLGGALGVRSEAGQGSTFTLSLPTESVSADDLLDVAAIQASFDRQAIAQATTWAFSAQRVLVVDDAAENRELLTLLLGDRGLRVEVAQDGAVAVEAALATPFDAILMDIQMPVMDGFEAVALMREHGLQIPIIALTANAMKGYEQRILAAGFSHYQTKPIDIDALSALLAELLGATVQSTANTAAPVAPPLQGEGPLFSTLAADPQFLPIVAAFLTKLDARLEALHAAAGDGDFNEIARIGHWLKGSGGTVGFGALTQPAQRLEAAANACDADAVDEALAGLTALRKRLSADAGGSADACPMAANENDCAIDSAALIHPQAAADTPVMSTLAQNDPRFAPIVDAFLLRLAERLGELDTAEVDGDREGIALFAHWLKGSGGNVGFDGFTEPAQALREAARHGDEAALAGALARVRDYARRVLPADGARRAA